MSFVQSPFRRQSRWKLLSFAFGLVAAMIAATPSQIQAASPQIGSPNTAVADPPIQRPSTTPVVVPLFSNFTFADFNAKTFSYAPPGGSGPWAKIVLVGDFSITAGNQFDRTGEISIGYTNVYFGTTPEPSSNFGPTWHFERDLTDYGALLKTAQPGEVDSGNFVSGPYTGIIYGSASLYFYPANPSNPAPVTPDVVLPLPNAPGGAATLSSTSSVLSETFNFPTNVTRAYLDVITQSQHTDEFWYTNVPDDLTGILFNNGNTAFREAEISVDGNPAGVAPVYPWIYTGGIDPFLWTPIPGVQALNFTPYRVDLTPFAASFNDGKPHSVGNQRLQQQRLLLGDRRAAALPRSGLFNRSRSGHAEHRGGRTDPRDHGGHRSRAGRQHRRAGSSDSRSRVHDGRLCPDLSRQSRYAGGSKHQLLQSAAVRD